MSFAQYNTSALFLLNKLQTRLLHNKTPGHRGSGVFSGIISSSGIVLQTLQNNWLSVASDPVAENRPSPLQNSWH